MLVLSRKVGEEIVIAHQVRIRIASIRGSRVRLAIAAPASVSVHRQEVKDRFLESIESTGDSLFNLTRDPA